MEFKRIFSLLLSRSYLAVVIPKALSAFGCLNGCYITQHLALSNLDSS